MTEKELRQIGFKVVQITRVRSKFPWSKPAKEFLTTDLYKWNGENWVQIPKIELGL
jgi:hypothetical protein